MLLEREAIIKYRIPKKLPLSPRMCKVLELMSYGLYYQQIANELNISEQTAKNYGRYIAERLGARNRAHAIRLGFQKGYLNIQNNEIMK